MGAFKSDPAKELRQLVMGETLCGGGSLAAAATTTLWAFASSTPARSSARKPAAEVGCVRDALDTFGLVITTDEEETR